LLYHFAIGQKVLQYIIICDLHAISVLLSIIILIKLVFFNSYQIFSSINKAIVDKNSQSDTRFSYIIELKVKIIFEDSKARPN